MYSSQQLKKIVTSLFIKMNCSRVDAEIISDVLIEAELRNIPSHGLIRIKEYFELWKAKRINPKPNIRIVRETPSTAVVDGDSAFGMIAANYSMQVAINKAKKVGSGWVATRNSNHFGIAGYYAMMALKHNMIGLAMTNANPLVAPTFSREPMLGTNPLAVAIPAKKQPPFVADFATTPIARGKLNIMARNKQKAPLGVVQDKDGNPSDNPDILKCGGSMLTLGGDYEHGSHKGYCMSAIIDIFSSVFSGANFGPFVPPSVAYLPLLDKKVGEGTGHFFGALRIDAFQSPNVFKQKMDQWILTFRKAKPIKSKKNVLIPGDIERISTEEKIKNGIELIPSVVDEINIIAKQLNISKKPLLR